jgi:hypothetical protein
VKIQHGELMKFRDVQAGEVFTYATGRDTVLMKLDKRPMDEEKADEQCDAVCIKTGVMTAVDKQADLMVHRDAVLYL